MLSGSADMQLRVWSALDGECPVTMRGHHGRITDVAIVARGRNVLSASADGTVRLWEVASASELLTLVQAGSPVNKILLAAAVPEGIVVDGTVDTTLSSLPDERQVETAGKVVFYACENGRVGVSMVATGRKVC